MDSKETMIDDAVATFRNFTVSRDNAGSKTNIRNNGLNGKKAKEVREINGKKILFYMGIAVAILTAVFISRKVKDKKDQEYEEKGYEAVTDYATGETIYVKPNR